MVGTRKPLERRRLPNTLHAPRQRSDPFLCRNHRKSLSHTSTRMLLTHAPVVVCACRSWPSSTRRSSPTSRTTPPRRTNRRSRHVPLCFTLCVHARRFDSHADRQRAVFVVSLAVSAVKCRCTVPDCEKENDPRPEPEDYMYTCDCEKENDPLFGVADEHTYTFEYTY